MLYLLNAGGSRISNMTFPCVMKVMKIMKISLHIFISLNISAFLCISPLNFPEFLYTSAFLWILLHLTFYILGQFDGAYCCPMDAIFVIITAAISYNDHTITFRFWLQNKRRKISFGNQVRFPFHLERHQVHWLHSMEEALVLNQDRFKQQTHSG